MNKNCIAFIILLLVLGGVSVWYFVSREPQTPTEDVGNELEKANLIRIFAPRPNQNVYSPLVVQGEARGNWFFEASFPVKLYDGNGKQIALGVAQAQNEWMTTNFVPFRAELTFEAPATPRGTLILEKDNPSGLPEHADELRVPVRFDLSQDTMGVQIFFSSDQLDSDASCTKVFPVQRTVPRTPAVARAALEELLKGPSDAEKARGFFTTINENVRIQSLAIENGVAKADFGEQLEFQVGGSCRVAAIRAQITETLKQFLTVKSVIISVNGRTEDILQP